jgi:hypothetical protein
MTAYALGTHEYKEAVKQTLIWIKTGEKRILGGIVVIPQGKTQIEKTHLGLCLRCGKKERTSNHGYFNVKGL